MMGHGHKDSWGRETEGCEVIRELGRTTWTLCGKPKVAVAVYGGGARRYICKSHLSGMLRKRTFYADEVVEIHDLDGNVTHRLVRTAGRKGYMKAVTNCLRCAEGGAGAHAPDCSKAAV